MIGIVSHHQFLIGTECQCSMPTTYLYWPPTRLPNSWTGLYLLIQLLAIALLLSLKHTLNDNPTHVQPNTRARLAFAPNTPNRPRSHQQHAMAPTQQYKYGTCPAAVGSCQWPWAIDIGPLGRRAPRPGPPGHWATAAGPPGRRGSMPPGRRAGPLGRRTTGPPGPWSRPMAGYA